MDRNLDGVYFRMQRDGKWENVCFSDLTEAERDSVMEGQDVKWLKTLCCHLANSIRRIGDELDIIGE